MSYCAALGYFRRGYQRKDTVYPILCVWFRDANFYNFDKLKGGTIIFSTISKFTVKYLFFLVNVDMSCYCRVAMKAAEHHNAIATDFSNNLIQ